MWGAAQTAGGQDCCAQTASQSGMLAFLEVPSEHLLIRAPLATWPHVLHQGQGDAGMQHALSLFPTLQLKVLF